MPPASASNKASPVLRLKVDDAQAVYWTPLLPDRGKLMHLFLIREESWDAFAHLHPVQRESRLSEVALPPLPPGRYAIYADVTHEDGLTQTVNASVEIPQWPETFLKLWRPADGSDEVCSLTWLLRNSAKLFLPPDPDDSWHVGGAVRRDVPAPKDSIHLSRQSNAPAVVWEQPGSLLVNRDASLRFQLVSSKGQPLPLEPYMGMLGHAAIRRDDGAVFAHLHPVGTFSMAAQQFLMPRETPAESSANRPARRNGSRRPPDFLPDQSLATGEEADLMRPVSSESRDAVHAFNHANHGGYSSGNVTSVSFPYEFPRAGRYRIWVQLKSQGKVFTGVFDADVQPES